LNYSSCGFQLCISRQGSQGIYNCTNISSAANNSLNSFFFFFVQWKLHQNAVFEERLHINKHVLLWGFLAAGTVVKEFL